MKANRENLDKDRFYEVTDIPKDSTWYAEPGSIYCALGAIVRPYKERSGLYIIIKSAPNGFLSVSRTDDDSLRLGKDITLRPLNKKDQAKLQKIRDQFT